MTSETTPESGTTTFIYDTAGSGCGNYSAPGSLVEREDSMATVDVTCYEYDPFGRVTSITYPSGQYSGVTPPKYFVYDAATVDNAAMANAKGRLAEAYTGPSGAKITDEGFGYDAMGRPTDLYEMAPSSGGYYHASEGYWLDGEVAQLNIPGVPAIAYNPNAVGEVSTVEASGSAIATASYNAGGAVGDLTGITYGSGDTDAFTYDPAMRWMTKYAFDINGQTETGTLNWNADGTLGSLDISDPFDAGDTQDCSFTQDDLGRLASVNCGSEWSQTFSTDAFGDVAVTGNDAFPAKFANDRISTVNGFAPNYDNDGNLLDNPLTQARNVYGWDADGRPVEVDGASQTFDAFGRLVYNSTSPAEYVWTPDGRKAADMNGQNLNFAQVPLPGGAAAMYASGGLWYYAHPDWEGSWRLASSPSRTATGELAYSPYGAAYAGTGPDAFTGQWVDTPDNLNDFQHRLLAPMMDRWLSPDPAGIAAVNFSDPQSWNAYAYVGDQPLEATDPTGLMRSTDSNPYPPIDLPYFAGLSADPFPLADNTLFGFGNAGGPVMPPPGLLGRHGGDIALLPGPPLPDTVQSQTSQSCEAKILSAGNQQFGTNFTGNNVIGTPFAHSTLGPRATDTVNLNISAGNQIGRVAPGRYPLHWWTYLVGFGPTLHVPTGPTGLDSSQTIPFGQNSDYTEHLDNAYTGWHETNLLGDLLHTLIDIFGFGRNPCP